MRSLLDGLAEATESGDDFFRVVRAGQVVTFHSPGYKDFATPEDLLTLRRFLTQTEDQDVSSVLVVIDHREAMVYASVEIGAVPERIVAAAPPGHPRRLHSRHEKTDGKREPLNRRYFAAVAGALHGAARILLFGGGTGQSNTMGQLMSYLNDHHPDVARSVVGSVVVDTHHRTESQLLAEARERFAAGAG